MLRHQNMFANLLAASRGSSLGLRGGRSTELLIRADFLANGSTAMASRGSTVGAGPASAPSGSAAREGGAGWDCKRDS